ncbi:tryptophan 2,3-dioxygenase family protein [Microbaculum marinum]|uniref:Tryptophan 2,3-dioxygenase n=1 Tax=Microbaculum marinum TaxID=1764581 RepID=A0AAW9RT80_9HYPH
MTIDPKSYAGYLQLETLLASQKPVSAAVGRPAHDEHLFIIVHQVYELWFKQVLYELDRVEAIFAGPWVEDRDVAAAAAGLARVVEILKLGVRQIDLLETMTPLDFLDFRDLLFTGSGFQSLQFREIEVRLGLKRENRLRFDDQPFEHRLIEPEQTRIRDVEARPSLFDMVEAWLGRVPFLETAGWQFQEAYRSAVTAGVREEIARISDNPTLGDRQREGQVAALEEELGRFEALFSSSPKDRATPAPGWRMARGAVLAALFINLYRDEPALQVPFRFLSHIMDIDETLTTWRFRHAQMVERMIGRKVGTGGSSGHSYLNRTVEQHRIFSDLFALATFLMPRAARPDLPEALRRRMALAYAPVNGQDGAPDARSA